jgi:quercetin dioxygenase-like cupin family protein
MKRYMLRFLGVAGLSVFLLAVLLGAQAEKAAKPAVAKKAVLRAASEMKWVDIPEAKGAQQAVVSGNPQKGAHSSFAKFAGGTELPLHTHTAGSRSVVIAGTMLEGLEGQQPKELGPGSYFYIPGELKHTTACKAGADCIIYTDWQGAFDMKPATP